VIQQKLVSASFALSDFDLKEILGFGRASTVYRAVERSAGIDVALKCYQRWGGCTS
jgi:hypothetical protein